MKKTWNNFILGFVNGIAILTPVIITVLIIRFLVVKLNDIVLNPLVRLLEPLQLAGFEVPLAKTIILVLAVVTVAFIGWGAKIWVIRKTFSWGESLLIRLPFMGKIYNAVKQITSSFMTQGKVIFKQVVLVEFPRKGMYSIGFVTGEVGEELKARTGQGGVKLLIPTAPNPTTGFFIIAPKEELTYLDMSVEDAIKIIISGGVMSQLKPPRGL